MKALFDLSFTRFISPAIVKIVYVLIMVALAIFFLAFLIAGFASRNPVAGLFALIFGAVIVLLYLVLARVGLEALLATIRTAENTTEIVAMMRQGAQPPTAGRGFGSAGPTPPYPGQAPGAPTGTYPTQPWGTGEHDAGGSSSWGDPHRP
ncbi:hypothetical protein BKD30_03700 [Tersicoccus phoenicis]|uniref:DUF4282 domain-containing protein n=1 Tax=Tersicoccus phoenicis TaxID=554083 RepID=A0A1R1LJU7_9MICC|nr:DUF4282 domain-containing protein [Tersicoccus phoenicis]OMH27746.1 hypothetical protein BKD30_03700 [Tersicoccus phoenicis]